MNKRIFSILAFCMFSSTLGIGIVIPLFPLYVKEMGASGVWIGIMFSAYAVSNSVFAPLSGRLADRRGRKWLLTLGLLAYAFLSLGYVVSRTVPQLVLVRFIQGIAGAMTFPIANTYIGDLSPEQEEGKWTSYSSAIFFSGFGLGPLLGGAMTEQFGMTAAFVTMGGFNFAAFLVALFFLPESRRTGTKGEGADDFQPSFREMSGSRMVRGLFGFQLLQGLGGAGIGAFLPIFAAGRGLSSTLIGILLTVNILSMTVLIPIGGLIADRFNRRRIIMIGGCLGVVLLSAIVLTNGFVQLLTILVLMGVNSAFFTPAASALAVEEGRRYGMGSTMSMLFLAAGVGMAIGPIVSGRISDSLNIQSVFYFGSVMALLGTGVFAWFTRRRTDPV